MCRTSWTSSLRSPLVIEQGSLTGIQPLTLSRSPRWLSTPTPERSSRSSRTSPPRVPPPPPSSRALRPPPRYVLPSLSATDNQPRSFVDCSDDDDVKVVGFRRGKGKEKPKAVSTLTVFPGSPLTAPGLMLAEEGRRPCRASCQVQGCAATFKIVLPSSRSCCEVQGREEEKKEQRDSKVCAPSLVVTDPVQPADVAKRAEV